MIAASVEAVRAAIAAAAAPADDGPSTGRDARLGDVDLHVHQQAAVRLVRRSIAEFGGALLADDVGLGKTYVALAAARDAPRTLVVAPAALRPMWAAAAARAGRPSLAFRSFEQLSRGGAPPTLAPDLLIVDEAHHARTPTTARYRHLTELATGGVPVLLLSATPVHNSPRDLAALLGVFLGVRARTLTAAELARCVVRREQAAGLVAGAMPRVLPPEWLPVGDASGVLDAILALPPPFPLADGGDGGALVAHALVRQWASSDAALRGALRRRLAAALAVEAALARGRHPTRRELAGWSCADDTIQLGFPELLASPTRAASPADTAAAVRAHAAGVRAALRALDDAPSLDRVRAEALRALRERHRGERVVAFSAYGATVAALAHELRREPRVCALTGAGARVAGGRLTRREALHRFAPAASGVRPPPAAESIDLLLATDLLSEGVNLQDASVVVHLDLPWTAARLAQRVGRAARLGCARPVVRVYALAPPASAERLVEVERVIRRKLAAACQLVGASGAILPPALDHSLLAPTAPTAPSAPGAAEELRTLLASWRDGQHAGATSDPAREPLVAAVRAPVAGWIAALRPAERDAGGSVVVLAADGRVTDAPAAVADAVRAAAAGAPAAVDGAHAARALAAVARWQGSASARAASGVVGGIADGARRRLVARIATITRRAGAHERPLIAPLAAAAHRAAGLRFGAGAERVLGELAGAHAMPDDAWLRAVATFGDVHARPAPSEPPASARVAALLLLVPPDDSR